MRAEITIYEDNKEPKTYELEASSIDVSTNKELGIIQTDYYYKFKYTTLQMGEVREC